MPRVFVSYSHDSEEHKARVLELTQQLRTDGFDAWIDRFECSPSEGWPRWIQNQMTASDCVVFVCTKTYEDRFLGHQQDGGLGATYEGFIATQMLYDEHVRNKRFIPVFFENEDKQHIPLPLKGADCHELPAGYPGLMRHILNQPDVMPVPVGHSVTAVSACSGGLPPLSDPKAAAELRTYAGRVPVDAIHESKTRLPGEVFAVELLTRPVVLLRNRETGRFTVIVDRRGVTDAVTTNAARNEEARRATDGRQYLVDLDLEIHEFLLGNSENDHLRIDLPALGIPLRWASGGVLPVVTGMVQGSQSEWTPLWFRDIEPWGWNLTLGACERQFDADGCVAPVEDELNDPALFILREFLEETLVLDREPIPGDSRDLPFKQFHFDNVLVEVQRKWANCFTRKHVDLRQEQDNAFLCQQAMPAQGLGGAVVPALSVFDTKTDLLVIDRNGHKHIKLNVLVTINLLELGIEIVQVLKYHLSPNDYILDGEILWRENGDTELVRMPCALISHKALKRSFGSPRYRPKYTRKKPGEIRAIQGKKIEPSEIKYFAWDAKQRLIRMDSPDPRITDAEKARHRRWKEKFIKEEKCFLENGDLNTDNIPSRFTAGTAKTLSLYFRRKSEQ